MKKKFSKNQLGKVIQEILPPAEPKFVFDSPLEINGEITFIIKFEGNDAAITWKAESDGALAAIAVTEKILQAQYQENGRKREAGATDLMSTKTASRYKEALYLLNKVKENFLPLVYDAYKSVEQPEKANEEQ